MANYDVVSKRTGRKLIILFVILAFAIGIVAGVSTLHSVENKTQINITVGDSAFGPNATAEAANMSAQTNVTNNTTQATVTKTTTKKSSTSTQTTTKKASSSSSKKSSSSGSSSSRDHQEDHLEDHQMVDHQMVDQVIK
ncbi:MAG: hypothetical protein SOZ23_00495 [Methanosphaera sp.]|uniref:hypothetical protein n=1 Tax=Methanosphaera sp. TaxID=2666342 RepID=UPI002A7EAD5F|nr:hypothetical protein [Methanosphaera sp.]MDY3955253.1 hypothetical protein [Methanosphaera sp.]